MRVDEFSAIENIFPPNARTSHPCCSRDACACTHVFCALALCALVTLNGIITIIVRMRNLSIFRSDHPSNSKIGGACAYFRQGLPIKRRSDLEELQGLIVTEIVISRKKLFFVTLYRGSNQSNVQFEDLVDKLQGMVDKIQAENLHSVILTGDFNCRSPQWLGRRSTVTRGYSVGRINRG